MAVVISGTNNSDKITATDGLIDLLSSVNFASEVTVPSFKVGSDIQIGNAGIITATTLVGNVQGNINHTSNLLLQISGSEKFRVGTSGQLGIGGANYGTSGQVLTSGGSSSAATWSTISGTTINNNADNRVITGSGSANTLNGESTLTYDGTTLSNGAGGINLQSTGGNLINVTSTNAASRSTIKFNTNGNDWEIGARGSETPNASNSFYVYDYETSEYRLVINPTGNVGIGTKDAIAKLDVRGGTTGITTSVVISGSVGIGITHPDSALDVVSSKTDGTNTHLGGAYNDDGQIAVRRIEFGTKNYRNSIQSQQGSGGDNFSSGLDLLLNPLGGNVGVGTTEPVQKFQVGFGTQGFVVSAGGTVGIGTTNPKTKLDVHGTDAIVVPVGTTAERPSNASSGMFRYNTTEGQFEGYTNAWGSIGGGAGATGGGNDEVFFESDQAVTTNYTLTANKNAHTVSPTINSGVTVTVPSGAILVIL